MKTHTAIPSPVLPIVTALSLALFAALSAHAARELSQQVQVEAKFVEVSPQNLKELGFDWLTNYNTSVSPRLIQPGGVTPQTLGTFDVNPPKNLPPTGDIKVFLSPQILNAAVGGNATATPRVTTASAQRAVTDVVRDLGVQLDVTPSISRDRSGIEMNLAPTVTEFTPWSVDVFGTAAFGQVGGSVRTTRDILVKDTKIVDVPTKVLVPFDNGFQIVDREETRLVPTEDINNRRETITGRRDVNRLDDIAGGGGLRVNYKFNPYVGLNVRGEVLDGCEPLGLVTGSIFGEYDGCWPFIPTYSLGGGVLFPCATAVMDVGLGIKRHITPSFDIFTEAHLITNFGRTTFGEFNVGASFPLGRKETSTAGYGGGPSAPETERPQLGRIPVIAHVFRQRSGEAEKRNLVIFVTPRLIQPVE